jgi:mono/diheme cytochrome c family protein
MHRVSLRVAGLAGLFALISMSAAYAQAGGALFDQGHTIFETNCAVCHQSSGEGSPPDFPALSGNSDLSDPALIVNRVHNGKEPMPAFTNLDAGQIAAVATYVRNAWTNSFGPVSEDQVTQILGSLGSQTAEAPAQRSIWDGVYTAKQAKGARLLYLGGCAACHGRRLNGAPDNPDETPGPPLAGTTFLRNWDGKSLAILFEFAKTKMPKSNPGQFSDQQYADIIAYMLSVGDAPAGKEALPPDIGVLQNIMIGPKPAQN